MNPSLSDRERATILAALRYWQREGLMSAGIEHDVASDMGRHKALSADEIDMLCERINCLYENAKTVVPLPTEKTCPTCPECGSRNVSADAAARWNMDSQEWEVSNVFDKGHSCDDCEATDIDFEWIELAEEAAS